MLSYARIRTISLKALAFGVMLSTVSGARADDFALPDPSMTPGAADTPEAIFCKQHSRERRSRKASAICSLVFDAYNIPKDPFERAGYQRDHLVPYR